MEFRRSGIKAVGFVRKRHRRPRNTAGQWHRCSRVNWIGQTLVGLRFVTVHGVDTAMVQSVVAIDTDQVGTWVLAEPSAGPGKHGPSASAAATPAEDEDGNY